MNGTIPHFRTVVAFSLFAVAGYLGFSLWAVLLSKDATVIGDVIGTWKSVAVLAFGFWLGSSSGGKATPGGPVETRVVNLPDDPVPTENV